MFFLAPSLKKNFLKIFFLFFSKNRYYFHIIVFFKKKSIFLQINFLFQIININFIIKKMKIDLILIGNQGVPFFSRPSL